MTKTGSCLCGAVQITLPNTLQTAGACHCSMCRKWSGGIYIGLHVSAEEAIIEGEDNITVFKSSEWAERAFCKTCGSNLFYRVTAPGPHKGDYHFGLGLLDNPDELSLTEEIFIDEKPTVYSFANDTKKMTGAEIFALFAPPE